MSELRNMTVGISFRDDATAGINRVNTQMDSMVAYFSILGNDISSLGSDFNHFGQSGQGAINGIQDSVNDMTNALDGASDGIQDIDQDLDALNDNGINDITDAANDAEDALDDAGNEADDLADNLTEAGTAGQNAAGGISSAFKKVGGILAAAFAVDKIKDLGIEMVEAAGETEALNAQFETVFGTLQGDATASINAMGKEFGMVPSRLQGTFTKTTSMFKGFGMSTEASMEAAGAAVTMAADAAAFYDVSMDDASGALTSFLKGNTNAAESIGIYATAAGMASFASDELGLNWKKLDEGGKQLVRLKYVESMQEAAEATGQAARESDGFENVLGNLKQSWFDLKAGLGGPILGVAIAGMKGLSAWMSGIDTEKVIGGFKKFGSYIGAVLTPIIQGVKNNLNEFMGFLRDNGALDGMKNGLDGLKEGLVWVKDNLSTVTAGIGEFIDEYDWLIAGVAAGVITFKAIAIAQTAWTLATKAWTTVTGIATTVQAGFNAVLKANPIGIAVTAVGLLVAGGILLYRNWDIVREKTTQLWEELGAFKGVATLLMTPIGGIIRAAVTMAENWDNTKSVWENVWNGIKLSASNAVNDVIGSINGMIEVINKIPGVNIPIVPKVDWGEAKVTPPKGLAGISNANDTKSKGASGISNAKPDGVPLSVGLARVPFDEMPATLHKDESVLTAQQSNAMRSMGLLKSRGDRPVLNLPESSAGISNVSTISNLANNETLSTFNNSNDSITNDNSLEETFNNNKEVNSFNETNESSIRNADSIPRNQSPQGNSTTIQQQDIHIHINGAIDPVSISRNVREEIEAIFSRLNAVTP